MKNSERRHTLHFRMRSDEINCIDLAIHALKPFHVSGIGTIITAIYWIVAVYRVGCVQMAIFTLLKVPTRLKKFHVSGLETIANEIYWIGDVYSVVLSLSKRYRLSKQLDTVRKKPRIYKRIYPQIVYNIARVVLSFIIFSSSQRDEAVATQSRKPASFLLLSKIFFCC